jgi:hypothetical protein
MMVPLSSTQKARIAKNTKRAGITPPDTKKLPPEVFDDTKILRAIGSLMDQDKKYAERLISSTGATKEAVDRLAKIVLEKEPPTVKVDIPERKLPPIDVVINRDKKGFIKSARLEPVQ